MTESEKLAETVLARGGYKILKAAKTREQMRKALAAAYEEMLMLKAA